MAWKASQTKIMRAPSGISSILCSDPPGRPLDLAIHATTRPLTRRAPEKLQLREGDDSSSARDTAADRLRKATRTHSGAGESGILSVPTSHSLRTSREQGGSNRRQPGLPSLRVPAVRP